MIRREWIDQGEAMAVVQQCVRAGLVRASMHAQLWHSLADASDLLHHRLLSWDDPRHLFRGTRRRVGQAVNRRRITCLLRPMPLAAGAPGPDSARSFPEHNSSPCLPPGVLLVEPNQVWSPDHSGIRPAHACAPLVALIDHRQVIGRRINHPIEAVVRRLDSGVCLNC
ncbi:hypothetical protein [Candidatus Accumulibacter contiguus]|uniref:Transposase n=1 Tax=Candidatus Accumulibacter contiguus TaxID=2954381 RepID=A0ABX1T6T5_9PROT|nr:hypothetical protein [Candidatus Accumulibacter contiguus]